ncbi:hypothetical protein G5V59_10535 [Nocardioides sp. W3-2-3]|uniref:hypothetical protein n=1 Tax=Nocardioides convexus TaxID=2712224 RepID=UPI002418BB52|nr:hypothetical protein [Nocardioides convexus]NHA00381.1 hypothetical protein [Nocardioides convexus]
MTRLHDLLWQAVPDDVVALDPGTVVAAARRARRRRRVLTGGVAAAVLVTGAALGTVTTRDHDDHVADRIVPDPYSAPACPVPLPASTTGADEPEVVDSLDGLVSVRVCPDLPVADLPGGVEAARRIVASMDALVSGLDDFRDRVATLDGPSPAACGGLHPVDSGRALQPPVRRRTHPARPRRRLRAGRGGRPRGRRGRARGRLPARPAGPARRARRPRTEHGASRLRRDVPGPHPGGARAWPRRRCPALRPQRQRHAAQQGPGRGPGPGLAAPEGLAGRRRRVLTAPAVPHRGDRRGGRAHPERQRVRPSHLDRVRPGGDPADDAHRARRHPLSTPTSSRSPWK